MLAAYHRQSGTGFRAEDTWVVDLVNLRVNWERDGRMMEFWVSGPPR